jgi:hypothetical protein
MQVDRTTLKVKMSADKVGEELINAVIHTVGWILSLYAVGLLIGASWSTTTISLLAVSILFSDFDFGLFPFCSFPCHPRALFETSLENVGPGGCLFPDCRHLHAIFVPFPGPAAETWLFDFGLARYVHRFLFESFPAAPNQQL